MAVLSVVWSCSGAPPERYTQKLVILGFDGLDPDLTARGIRAGRLPHLARLASTGGLHRLQTTIAPESPTAWASFATGVNAGKHNVFGLIARNRHSYQIGPSAIVRDAPRLLFDYAPVTLVRMRSTRRGTPFWVTAGQAGVRASILTVPLTFPPEVAPGGEVLSGFPLPDVRGTLGTYHYFASDLRPEEEGATELGGILRRLVFQGGTARAEIMGSPDPTAAPRGAKLADLRVPVAVTWNRDARTANIDLAGTVVHLAERQWSKWVRVEFRANPIVRFHGLVRLYLIAAGESLRLYVAPTNWDPARPGVAISAPPALARDLYDRLGPYRTLGWAESTWALVDERLDEQAFLEDVDEAFDDRAAIVLNRLDSRRWDLLVGVLEAPDRVQHTMWHALDPGHPLYDASLAARWGGAIDRLYQRVDALVGQVLARVSPATALLVVSDHGFHTHRYSVNLNTWLIDRGYLIRRAPRSTSRRLGELLPEDASASAPAVSPVPAGSPGVPPGEPASSASDVDWSRTRAYAAGFGQIYVNLRGRERDGVVRPGAEYEALVAALARDLRGLVDPRTGRRVVRHVYTRAEAFSGPYVWQAPDLQVAFENGYGVAWQTALGGAPEAIIEPNLRKWSGDHAALDPAAIPGTLLSSIPLAADAPRLIDIAPTVLKYFGIALPKDLDGRPLF